MMCQAEWIVLTYNLRLRVDFGCSSFKKAMKLAYISSSRHTLDSLLIRYLVLVLVPRGRIPLSRIEVA